ncbi:uncharacterized protein [Lolium perenne]|uniref:uncharacterized protein n=1 Tax=Lolium perenne TaxID=4522 RepID=UPI0021F57DCF|nr:uncharacterized protein LOC127339499 [Lolium perenne]
MASAQDSPAPPTKFFPPDHVLIEQFLRPKLAELPIDSGCNIHDFDAYSVSPDILVGKHEHAPGTDKDDGKRGHWYFFTPARRHGTRNGGGRRQRAVGEGYTWHSEGGEKPVVDGATGSLVGYKRKLNYVFKESPGSSPTRLGWCMTEFRLDDDAAGLVICMVCVSRHKRETTYESVMKAMADSKKRKASDDPHPDAPRPQTPRRQEMEELQNMERWLPTGALGNSRRWLLSDQDDVMPPGAVDDGSVDPAGFFTDIVDVEELCRMQQQRLAEDGHEEVTYARLFGDDDMDLVVPSSTPAPAPAFVSCDTTSSHVMAKCSKADCEICIQQMVEKLVYQIV